MTPEEALRKYNLIWQDNMVDTHWGNVEEAMELYATSQAISFAQWLEDTDKMKPFEYGSETASLIDNLDALYTLFLTHQSLHP